MLRKITNELAIAGQLTLDELPQLVQEGYRSVVNLRSSNEPGFLVDEQQQIECLGLGYANLPIQIENLNLDNVMPIIQHLVRSPKPILVHCESGMCAAIIVLLKIAIEQGIKAEDALQNVTKLGLLNH